MKRQGFGLMAAAAILAGCSSDAAWEAGAGSPSPVPNSPASGLVHPQSYRVIAEQGIVLDQVTGLSWQRSIEPGPGDGGGWVFADAVEHCASLDLGGHDDWRLPRRLELVSLVDVGRAGPAIDPDAFPATPTDWFWTSSPVADTTPLYYYYVNFYFGNTTTNDPVYAMQIRCARGPESREMGPYRVLDDEQLLDQGTGLVWERMSAAQSSDFSSARAACEGLDIAGETWRLPSLTELQSLIDESRAEPAMDVTAFPDAPSEVFWSGSPLAMDPTSAWYVSFADGFSIYDPIESEHRVRCVR